MSRYTLRDDGYAFKKIMTGRKWIGRVWKNAEGTFTGKIGKTEASGPSFIAAFENTVAKHLGHSSVQALHDKNAAISAANRANKARAQHAAREMLHGNFEPFEKLFLKD